MCAQHVLTTHTLTLTHARALDFLGQISLHLRDIHSDGAHWYKLQPREGHSDDIEGTCLCGACICFDGECSTCFPMYTLVKGEIQLLFKYDAASYEDNEDTLGMQQMMNMQTTGSDRFLTA